MENGQFLMDIVFGTMGFVLMTFFIFWFTGVNKAQKKHDVEINQILVNQIVNEKDNRIQDKEIEKLEKQNNNSKIEFYETSKELAKNMQELCNTKKENQALIKENLVLIKQNIHRIETLEEKQGFIIKEIIKNK